MQKSDGQAASEVMYNVQIIIGRIVYHALLSGVKSSGLTSDEGFVPS
jgi:hypothetical protein